MLTCETDAKGCVTVSFSVFDNHELCHPKFVTSFMADVLPSHGLNDEVLAWLTENVRGTHHCSVSKGTFFVWFSNEIDATLFKLTFG